MSTTPYGLVDNYTTGQPPSATDLNRRAKILASQLAGALAAVGPCVLPRPDIASLLVTNTGGTISIAPGEAIVRHTAGHYVYVRNTAALTVTPPEEEAPYYVHLALAIPAAPNDPDSQLGAAPVAVASTTPTIAGALLLAEVSIAGEVTDRRPLQGGSGIEWLIGSGRIAGLNATVGAPEKVTGTLQVRLPAGAVYFVRGRRLELADEVFFDAPANSTAWGVLSLDDDGELQIVADDWRTTKPNWGSGSIGKVTTGATAVTALDLNDEDIIQTEATKQQRLRSIEQQLAVLSVPGEGGGGSGGGGTGGGYAGADLLPWDHTAPTGDTTSEKVQSLLDGLKDEVFAYIDAGLTTNEESALQTADEFLFETIVRNTLEDVETNVHAPEAVEMAAVVFGRYGHSLDGDYADPGIADTPNNLLHNTLSIDLTNRDATP